MKKSAVFVLVVPSVVAALAFFPLENEEKKFHTAAELASFYQSLDQAQAPSSFIDSSTLFLTSRACRGCHGHDPQMHALVDESGKDVNIYDDWRSTMMANSAKDPFWRAKVTHEMLVNPTHSLGLQDKCTSCHAPAGHYQAKLGAHADHYLLSDLYADTLGLDGVTCQACHAQAPELLGDLHSGQLNYDTNKIRVAYGPYKIVFAPPMSSFVGITPLFGPHIGDAGLCAGCHTLLTKSVDLAGNYTGSTFVEQATYHEWLNSRYDEQHDNITCQGCHMQQIDDGVVISANYVFLTPKSPFGLHELAGANTTMLKLMRDNRQKLGIEAEAEHFDSTIAATLRMLQQQTLTLDLKAGDVTGDSMNFSLKMLNKAGHKFPSGYPARRAWVEFELKNAAGQTIFHSGKMAADYSLPDEDANFEPHYQTISEPGQVQIYELVPGDVSGAFTTVLERAHLTLKDNRLVPQGFHLNDPVYDTTQIVGVSSDADFNHAANGEGSGSDILHFRLPNGGYTGNVSVRARVWYQSLPPKWMAPMFAFSTPEIDSFRTMFDAAERAPVLIAEASLDSVFVSPVSTKNPSDAGFVQIFPSLSLDGRVNIRTTGNVQIQRVRAWDSAGRLVWDRPSSEPLQLPEQRGLYLVAVETPKGRVVERVVRQ